MKCLDYFFKLLSRREYTANELIKKGQEKNFSQTEINQALNTLQEQDYQSDTRFILSVIHTYQNKYGKYVIRRKCLEKGIQSDLFDQIWEQENEENPADDHQLDELKAKIMRKYKLDNFQNIDPKIKSKLWNYLQYRGFNPSGLLEEWRMDE